MKKLFACVILSFLMIATLVVSAFAAEDLTVALETSKASVNQGDTVTVTISATADNVKSIAIVGVTFNENVFKFVSGKWLNDGIMSDFDNDKKTGVWASKDETKLSGTDIVSLSFRVLDSAVSGSTDISVKVSINSNAATADAKCTVSVGCNHVFDKKVETDAYLATAATCKAGASYYFSCACGEKGTETFSGTAGTLGDHKYSTEYKSDKDNHWNECTVCGAKNTLLLIPPVLRQLRPPLRFVLFVNMR